MTVSDILGTVRAALTLVCCQQLAPRVGAPAHNRELSIGAIERAAADGVRVVVLPELVSSGYMFESAAEATSLAIGLDDPLLHTWVALAAAHRLVLAAGFCERGGDGRTYNSAALIDETGMRAVYRKLHLWDREREWFTAGDALPPVVETSVGRVSVVICYDLEFPELVRTVALGGADLLLVPTNWPRGAWPAGERPAEVVNAMAAARCNRMAIACADRAGEERGQAWTQGSAIVDVDGRVLDENREAGAAVLADVDLARSRDKRFTERADAFADRRPELYGAVSAVATAARA